MTATAKISPPKFFVKFVGSGFSLSRMQDKDVKVERGTSGADALSRLKGVATSTTCPPGPKDTWLGETIIHAADIREPLGISHDYPVEAVARVADFYKGSNLVVGAKKRIAGLKLTATDTNWTHGEGTEVSGPVLALVQAMTGRMGACDQLSGDGVATLRSR